MWQPAEYQQILTTAAALSPEAVRIVYRRVFRATRAEPGFALLSFRTDTDSRALRAAMLALVAALSTLYESDGGGALAYQSALRFDQQTTTRFHLNGGPDESYLLLGYEPTVIESRLAIADHSRAAEDLGIAPAAFLDRFPPMQMVDPSPLARELTHLDTFDPARANLLVINNSRAGWGVLHRAVIENPVAGARCVINSVQIAPERLAPSNVLPADLEAFAVTDAISRA